MSMRFSGYDPEGFYDELYERVGEPRSGSSLLLRKFASLANGELKKRIRLSPISTKPSVKAIRPSTNCSRP